MTHTGIFLHLSDIHFGSRDIESQFDLDKGVRNQLRLSLNGLLPYIGQVTGVLVTGDIAFAGKKTEYEVAETWLRDICAQVGCKPSNVWVVPGNHDIDHDIIRNSPTLQLYHERIRSAGSQQAVDTEMRKWVEDDLAGSLLFEPLGEYNIFADRYNCATTISNIAWVDDENLELDERSRLRIVGMNSVLVSGLTDDKNTRKLVLGRYQALPEEESGVILIGLCHHPPSWLMHETLIVDQMLSRITIQLFGHEHQQRVRRVDGSVQIFAGALHPDRGEGDWEPRYNVIRIQIAQHQEQRCLHVEIWAQVWDKINNRFVPEGSLEQPTHSRYFPLEEETVSDQTISTTRVAPIGVEERIEQGPENVSTRETIFQYFSLPYARRLGIVIDMDLLRDDDKNVEERELLQRFLAVCRRSPL